MHTRLATLAATAILAALAAPAAAAPFALDDFSTYTPGPLSGQAGSPTGFSGTWSGFGFQATGSAIESIPGGGMGHFASRSFAANSPAAQDGDTIFVGFDLLLTPGKSGDGLFSSSGITIRGQGGDGTFWAFGVDGGNYFINGGITGGSVTVGSEVRLVSRLTRNDAGGEPVVVWVDPTNELDTPVVSNTLGVLDPSETGLASLDFRAFDNSNSHGDAFTVSDLRFGTRFSDVTTASAPPTLSSRVSARRLGRIAAALDAAREGAGGKLSTLIGELDGLSDADLVEALERLSPARLEVAGRSTLPVTRDYHSRLSRYVARQSGVGGPVAQSGRSYELGDALRAGWFAPEIAALDPADLHVDDPSEVDVAALAAPRWNAFVEATGAYGEEDGRRGRVGQRYRGIGVLAGADYLIGEDVAAGLSMAYAATEANERSGGAAEADVHTARVGPYLGVALGPVTLDAGVSGGLHWIDQERPVTIGGITSVAESDHQAWDVSAHGSARLEHALGETLSVGPIASVQYTHLDEESFTERAGAGAALRIGSRETDSLTSDVGAHARWQVPVEQALGLGVEASWVHEYLDTGESFEARFAGGSGGSFRVRTPEADRDALRVAASVDFALGEDVNAKLGWEGKLSANAEDHTGGVRFEVKF